MRYTYEESHTCQEITRLVEEGNLRTNGILVITDTSGMKKIKDQSVDEFMQHYIQREKVNNAHNQLGHFLSLFGDRFVILDDLQDEDFTQRQLSKLMSILDQMPPKTIRLQSLESNVIIQYISSIFDRRCTIL